MHPFLPGRKGELWFVKFGSVATYSYLIERKEVMLCRDTHLPLFQGEVFGEQDYSCRIN